MGKPISSIFEVDANGPELLSCYILTRFNAKTGIKVTSYTHVAECEN